MNNELGLSDATKNDGLSKTAKINRYVVTVM